MVRMFLLAKKDWKNVGLKLYTFNTENSLWAFVNKDTVLDLILEREHWFSIWGHALSYAYESTVNTKLSNHKLV